MGVRTLRFVDQTRATPPNGSFAGTPFRPLDTEVWYPAAAPPTGTALRDAPLDTSGAPYPLVLYGHALQDRPPGEAYLAEHLASRGYIVAAVDFPLGKLGAPGGATPDDLANQPGDLRAVLEHLLAGDGGLAGAVDAARVGASGLSLGAATVMLLTYHRDLRDRRIRAVLPIAPAFSCAFTRAFYKGVRPPLLVLQGRGRSATGGVTSTRTLTWRTPNGQGKSRAVGLSRRSKRRWSTDLPSAPVPCAELGDG